MRGGFGRETQSAEASSLRSARQKYEKGENARVEMSRGWMLRAASYCFIVMIRVLGLRTVVAYPFTPATPFPLVALLAVFAGRALIASVSLGSG